MSDPRKSHPLPPESFIGRNMDAIPLLLPVGGYCVAEWTPERDGKGTPTMVWLCLELAGRADGAEVVLRIKSRLEMNRLIKALERHRDGVWPETAP